MLNKTIIGLFKKVKTMKNSKKLFSIALFLVISVFFLGANAPVAKAATVEGLQAQIEALIAQVAELQQRLTEIQPASTVWSHDFNRNLKYGMGGTEVKALQTALEKEGFYQRTITGNFDEYTASAVVGFQEKYASEVLAPYPGLVHGTGFVGPTTRAKLNQLYGCKAVCKELWWYDNDHRFCQKKKFCGLYMYLGLRTFPTKAECEASLQEKSITVISPDGGEKWVIGTTHNITWSSEGFEKVEIELVNYATPVEVIKIANSLSASLEKYSWTLPDDLKSGDKYKIQVRVIPRPPHITVDESDNYFSIVKEGENLPPVVDGLTAPTQLKINQTGTWIIKAHDPENGVLSYRVDWGDEVSIPYSSSAERGVQTTSFTHSYNKVGTYTIKFTVTDDHRQTARTSTTVKVVSKTCHTTPLWDWDYCSPGCKCYAGEGDCDDDTECHTGYCHHNVGLKYGQVYRMDVCEEKEGKSITVISPNGGEEWVIGKTYNITWKVTGIPENYKIGIIGFLKKDAIKYSKIIDVNINASVGNYGLTVPSDLIPGEYKIGIHLSTLNGKIVAEDLSDNYFSILKYPTSCTDLENGLQESWNTTCGDAKYNPVYDLNKDKSINYLDYTLLGTRMNDEAWCKTMKESTEDPCKENHSPKLGEIAVFSSVKPRETVSFTFTATDSDEDNLSWSIDWGDSSVIKGVCPSTQPNTTFKTSHSWSKVGTYIVKVTVSDCRGGSDRASFNMNVKEEEIYQAEIDVLSYDKEVPFGEDIDIKVNVTNTGTATWTSTGLPEFHCRPHAYLPDGTYVHDITRGSGFGLPYDVAPGQSATLDNMKICTGEGMDINQIGELQLGIDMVYETKTWFGNEVKIPITIIEASGVCTDPTLVKYCDYNRDRKVDGSDVSFLEDVVIEARNCPGDKICDVNCDTKTDLFDVLELQELINACPGPMCWNVAPVFDWGAGRSSHRVYLNFNNGKGEIVSVEALPGCDNCYGISTLCNNDWPNDCQSICQENKVYNKGESCRYYLQLNKWDGSARCVMKVGFKDGNETNYKFFESSGEMHNETIEPIPDPRGLGLKNTNIESQLASISDAVAEMLKKIKELIGR